MSLTLETTRSCRRAPLVLFLLEELATPYDLVWREDGHFLAHHGTLGPLLRDGDSVVLELDTLLRHLARTRSTGDLMPLDPAGLAEVDRWMEVQATLRVAAIRVARGDGDGRATVLRCLGALEAALGGRSTLLGRFTVADVPAAALWQLRQACDLTATPRVAAWAERVVARPAWRRALDRLASGGGSP